jgi:hypothetical protein
MKKLLILLVFLFGCGLSRQSLAQCYGCNVYSGAGYYGYGYYPYYASLDTKIAYGIDSFFYALQDVTNAVAENRAIEADTLARRNQLENNKTIQNYYTNGIPAFAPVAPDGKPRSPKITWRDVEDIH